MPTSKSIRPSVLIPFCIVCLSPAINAMAVSVVVSPTSVTNVSAFGEPWTSPSNAIGSDDIRASVVDSTAPGTDLLSFAGWDFSSIPIGSTIDGIELSLEGSGSDAFASALWGTGATTSTPVTSSNWKTYGSTQNIIDISFPGLFDATPAETTTVTGSPTDTWNGITLAILEDPNFTLNIAAAAVNPPGFFSVDDVFLTVRYSGVAVLPAATPWAIGLTIVLVLTLGGAYAAYRIRRQHA